MVSSNSPMRLTYRKSDRQMVYALFCLLLALLCLTIGFFMSNPVSYGSYVFLALGLCFAFAMSFFYFRYARLRKKEAEAQRQSAQL